MPGYMTLGKGASLKAYSTDGDLTVDGRGIPKAVRTAAYFAHCCARPVQQEAKRNLHLLENIVGPSADKTFESIMQSTKTFSDIGYLSWDPEVDELGYVYTPDFTDEKLHTPFPGEVRARWTSKVVMFFNWLAMPMAVVTMARTIRPGEPHKWEIRSVQLFGLNSSGDEDSRPILFSPYGDHPICKPLPREMVAQL